MIKKFAFFLAIVFTAVNSISVFADDRQRVADQEQKIIKKSIELGLPLEISLPAFREIMEESIRFQQEYIDQLISNDVIE